MDGIINVLKPPGISSHQVVSFMRKQLQTKKIGHAGTLDPGASGVLPLLVGQATKLSNYLMEQTKTYVTELTLGFSTTSQDASGDTVDLNTDFSVTPRELAEALASFQGTIWQTPPMASAVKVGGKKLYELDRQGISIPREPRQVQVYSINIMAIWHEQEDDLGFGTRVLLRIVCSKGTYVRTICHDLGEKLGVHAHMSFLARVASGPFHSTDAYTLEEISAFVEQGDYSFLLSLEAGLPDWVKVKVNPLVEERIKHGNFVLPEHLIDVPTTLTVGDDVVLLSVDGDVLALAEVRKTDQLICQPVRVLMR
ncbi:MAG: tRNA pseudouridine(55) synthase TruB [Firmicutes bacterium]|nr:tRNA pseudouridine(55) synthase TruB [Bacillota bacterium]